MTTRADVVACARSFLGTPYVHQGRSRHGVDCIGLLILVGRELGLVTADFDFNGYSRTPDGATLLAECDKVMDRIPMSAMQPGDVLTMRFDHLPQHMGFIGDYLHGGLSFIHALGTVDGKGSVVEHRLTPRKGWTPVQAYAIRGLQ